MFDQLPLTTRDQQFNNQNIVKIQYQKNYQSANSYLRVYGYTYYSDYVGTGAVSSWQPFVGFDSNDYELNSHTRGISATYAKQLNAQHLLQIGASYTTATSTRMNNTQMYDPSGCIRRRRQSKRYHARRLLRAGGSGGPACQRVRQQ